MPHILFIKMNTERLKVYIKEVFLSHQNLSFHNKINLMKSVNLLFRVQLNPFSEKHQMKRSNKIHKINRIKYSKRQIAMVIKASQIQILKVVCKIHKQQDLYSMMIAAAISSNLTFRFKILLGNSILISKHNNIKEKSIISKSNNSKKKLQIQNLSQKLKKMMTCSTISNRLR